MDIQWYPGHMTKTVRMMQEDIRLVDLVIELTDARVPMSGRNPDIDRLSNGKQRIILLNKADLSDEKASLLWKDYYEKQGIITALVNARSGEGVKQIQNLARQACSEKIERDKKRGIVNRPLRAMVCGIPNVGKSTLINSFSGRAAAKTGNRPGVTKGRQWIRLNKSLELLDTPGILWPKFEDRQIGLKLAVIGTIRDELLETAELAAWLLSYLKEQYPNALPNRYGCDTLEEIAAVRGCLRREGEIDRERAAALVIDDFRKGKLGKISLEFPVSTD